MRRNAPLLLPAAALLLLLAVPAVAQDDGTGPVYGDEVLFVDPANVASDQTDVVLRLYSSDTDFFAQAAGQSPLVEVGPGLTLTDTFQISPKELELLVDVSPEAFGAIEISVRVYSLDGATVKTLATTNLGVIGPTMFNDIAVSASANLLVEPDITGLQDTGELIFEGVLAGEFEVLAPAGVRFGLDSEPSVLSQTTGVTISNVAVDADLQAFRFTVANADFVEASVRIAAIRINMVDFTAQGGVEGGIVFTVTNGPSSPSFGVSVAHTAGQTIENPGEDDLGDGDTTEGTDDSGDTADDDGGPIGGGGGGIGGGISTPSSGDDGNDDSGPDTDGDDTPDMPDTPDQPHPRSGRTPDRADRADNSNRGHRANASPGRSASSARGARPARGSSRGGSRHGSGGSHRSHSGSDDATNASVSVIESDGTGMGNEVRIESFSLCDAQFRPLAGIGFRPATDGSGAFVATLHLQLVVSRDLVPDSRGRVIARITLPGLAPTQAELIETAPDSGVYRSAAGGFRVRFNPSAR